MNDEFGGYCRQKTLELGYAISYYRKKKGLSQAALAEIVGISRQHLGAIEAPNMERSLSLDVFFRIAAALEIEPYKFFKFGDTE